MKTLRCEICGTEWIDSEDTEERKADCESIEQTNKCLTCYEEFGDGWADRAY